MKVKTIPLRKLLDTRRKTGLKIMKKSNDGIDYSGISSGSRVLPREEQGE